MKLEYKMLKLGPGWMPKDTHQTRCWRDREFTGWSNHQSEEQALAWVDSLKSQGYTEHPDENP